MLSDSKDRTCPYEALFVRTIVVAIRGDVLENTKAIEAQTKLVSSYLGNTVEDALEKAKYDQPNWKHIIDPILNATSYDYVVCASLVVMLAYQIIYHRSAMPTGADEDFIINSFKELLGDDNVSQSIIASVLAEDCKPSNDLEAANTLFVLDHLLTQARLRTQERSADMQSAAEMSPRYQTLEASPHAQHFLMLPTTPDETRAPHSPYQLIPALFTTDNRHDVHVQYYLKPGHSLELGDITSHSLGSNTMILKTSDGLQVRIQEGVTVTMIHSSLSHVSIRAPISDGYELSVTVVVPPGHAYELDGVLATNKEDGIVGWMNFETESASLWIGNGDFLVQEREGGIVVRATKGLEDLNFI